LSSASLPLAQEVPEQRGPLAVLEKLPPRDALIILSQEIQKRKFQQDPSTWVQQRLQEHLWSKQQEILRAIATHRKVLVKSCHGIGKSFTAARAAAWWLDVHKAGEAFVVTSAPSGPQIKAILWREIGRAHSKGKLRGRVNQTEWYMDIPDGKEEIVAFGRKPDDYDPAAFQGIHARRVLVILDEANGIRGALHEAAESLTSNDLSKMLMIGNPDDPSGEYYDASKPGSDWFVVQIGAFDSPNFTGEEIPPGLSHDLIGRLYVEEKRKKCAPTWRWTDASGNPSDAETGIRVVPPEGIKPEEINPIWSSKILGEFPHFSEESKLIPLSWLKRAQAANFPNDDDPGTLGVDVGAGGDSSCGCHRRGRRCRIRWEDRIPDTMQTCGNVIAALHETASTVAYVDEIGIGRGVVDRAVEQKEPVIGVNVAESPKDEKRFMNQRAELYWFVREQFERGQIDIDAEDEDLAAELLEIKYKRTSSGKIQIESKQEAKNRGVASPNRAEALILSYATPRKRYTSATWGTRRG
jgi:hypothetical protein